ncbi:hypothetical protein THIX_70151 [Thiomonas sp. X19]|nr:hypothetical protein THIX_70151 [Thiomonas sp. X19]
MRYQAALRPEPIILGYRAGGTAAADRRHALQHGGYRAGTKMPRSLMHGAKASRPVASICSHAQVKQSNSAQ